MVALKLIGRDVDVLTAIVDGADRVEDERLLERATALGRVLVSQDSDFTVITSRWLHEGRSFAGFVRVPQTGLGIGAIIEQLELFAKVMEPRDVQNRVFYLPLW
jgi:hypothetical protein